MRWKTAYSAAALLGMLAWTANANAQGRGDNRDDPRSGRTDRVGDGNSGHGDDIHRPRPPRGPRGEGPRPGREGGEGSARDGRPGCPIPGPIAHRLRQRFDTNGDGHLDEAERQAARAWLSENWEQVRERMQEFRENHGDRPGHRPPPGAGAEGAGRPGHRPPPGLRERHPGIGDRVREGAPERREGIGERVRDRRRPPVDRPRDGERGERGDTGAQGERIRRFMQHLRDCRCDHGPRPRPGAEGDHPRPPRRPETDGEGFRDRRDRSPRFDEGGEHTRSGTPRGRGATR